jgi:hypothetical protein
VSAAATANVWPQIPKGNTLAVFQGRVWLNGLNTTSNQYNILQWTGTGATIGGVIPGGAGQGYDDFLARDASGSLIISDADLVHAITALRAANNYLFIMGDQSVKQIGNISLNSNANVTLFTIITLSSDQGTIFPQSCISFNRIFMFLDRDGVFGVFGSSVQKLSADLDGVFQQTTFSSPTPQGAIVDLRAIHYAVFLIQYLGAPYMAVFDGKRWFMVTQGGSLRAIATVKDFTSGLNQLFGSSGTDVTHLLANETTAVPYQLQTALTHHGNAVQGKRIMRAGLTTTFPHPGGLVNMTVDSDTGNGASLIMNIPNGTGLSGGANDNSNPQLPISNAGVYLGMTFSGTAFGLTFINGIIEYQESQLWKD